LGVRKESKIDADINKGRILPAITYKGRREILTGRGRYVRRGGRRRDFLWITNLDQRRWTAREGPSSLLPKNTTVTTQKMN